MNGEMTGLYAKLLSRLDDARFFLADHMWTSPEAARSNLADAKEHAGELIQQHSDLLAALRQLVAASQDYDASSSIREALKPARAVIAHAALAGEEAETMTTQDKIREFHRAFGHPVGPRPEALTYDRYELRLRLIEEEYEELYEARYDEDFLGMVDALADLVYVCYGMAIEMGVDLDEVISEVHAANMRKLGPDGTPIYRDDGKILKPEGWEGPDIAGVLEKQAIKGRVK